MVIAGFFFTVGAAINAGAQDLAMLYVGRVLLGFGVGFANQSVSHPVYVHLVSQNCLVSELPFVIAPSKLCTFKTLHQSTHVAQTVLPVFLTANCTQHVSSNCISTCNVELVTCTLMLISTSPISFPCCCRCPCTCLRSHLHAGGELSTSSSRPSPSLALWQLHASTTAQSAATGDGVCPWVWLPFPGLSWV